MGAQLERVRDFYDFMTEREKVRLRKEADLPRPWTDDPILQEFKFTNVKREHDRTSKGFLALYRQNWERYRETPTGSGDLLLNCAISRYFGVVEFISRLGWVQRDEIAKVKEFAAKEIALGKGIFTGAYVITNGGIKGPKHEVIVDHYLSVFAQDVGGISRVLNETQRWQDTVERMMETPGFGGSGFMSKETILDYIAATGWEPLDWQTWTPVGPGGKRGVARLLGIDTPDGVQGRRAVSKKGEVLDLIREVYDLRHKHWPDTMVKLDLTDIQFQLCEFDKYERVRLGQGKPRSRYR